MRNGRTIGNHRRRHPNSFESIPYFGRNAYEAVVVLTREIFHQLSPRRSALAIIVKDQPDDAYRNCIVQRHPSMQVPAFDHAGKDRRKIDLAKTLKPGIVIANMCMIFPRSSTMRRRGLMTTPSIIYCSLVTLIAPLRRIIEKC